MVYFGSYNIRTNIQNPEDFIDNYNYIFRVNALTDTELEIIDVMYMNMHYEYLNIDIVHNLYKECRIIPGMVLKYEDNTVYFTYPVKGLFEHIKMYEIFKDTKYIYLDSLDKIKENMIASNKILSS